LCFRAPLPQRKTVELEVPQAVLPDTVFEAMVKIPYDKQIKQFRLMVKGDLNVGMVLLLPKVLNLLQRIAFQNKKKVGKLYYQPYSPEQKYFSCWASSWE
jgi:apocytochrome f